MASYVSISIRTTYFTWFLETVQWRKIFISPVWPSSLLSVCVSVCVCVVLCFPVCVAVQKMAEAQMQKLGVYPPLEDPCEGEENEDQWEGEKGVEHSPTKAAGERETTLHTWTAETTLICPSFTG